MTIKRTHKTFQKEFLDKNKNLKILDLGCTHVNYWKEANHFADIVDYSKEATTDIFLDNDNAQDVLNTQLAVANRMIEKLRSGTLYLDKYQLDGSASCEPFMDRFENQIAGWATTFTILVQNDIDNEV